VSTTFWAGAPVACGSSGAPSGTLCNIAFWTAANGGGLSLNYVDDTVNLYGPALGVDGAYPAPFTLSYLTGTDFYPNINDSAINQGGGLFSLAVPEPETWILLLLGLAGAGLVLRRGRARVVAAAA
jgi:hypothetical protein